MLDWLFKGDKETREQRFWNWFVHNKEKIGKIQSDRSIVPELANKLAKYSKLLRFEVGVTADGSREFSVGCDGIGEGIPHVEKLVRNAPQIDGWLISKYRKRKDIDVQIEIDGLEMSSDDIFIQYCLDGNLIHLRLFIKNYTEEDDRYMALAFLFLDNTLGEFDVMTRVGGLEFVEYREDMKDVQLISLKELREIVDEQLDKNAG